MLHDLLRLTGGVSAAFLCSTASAISVVVPADGVLDGPAGTGVDVAFAVVSVEATTCPSLSASECNVEGSFAIGKYNFGAFEPGPLLMAGQVFTVEFDDDEAGTWSYNHAPSFVTAWLTTGGRPEFGTRTLFWLVPDGTLEGDATYTGLTAATGVDWPWHTPVEMTELYWFDTANGAPEPSAFLLFGAALAGLGLVRRRRTAH
jgi:hypothetical protein